MTRERERERRQAIVTAARWCFLNFGFGKTSLDDIAKRADISRPLVYRSFPNKDEIYRAVIEDGFDARFPAAEAALAGSGGKLSKLLRVADLMMIEPWAEMVGAPMAAEFYATCERVCPEVEAKQQRRMVKLFADLLGGKELAEIFLLAVYGMIEDLPTTVVLRRRLQLLAERFLA
jgi:TetR/AcrR family transcriptional regulator, transcriptional repressor of aconitase